MGTLTFVRSVLEAWEPASVELAARGFRSESKVDECSGTGAVEIQGNGVYALIQVWEHAHCLDATVLYGASGRSQVLAAGPCRSTDEAQERISKLRAGLLEKGGTRAV
jgi:hypothetical protein